MSYAPSQLVTARDQGSWPAFLRLKELLGNELKAGFTLWALWSWLAYSAESSGTSGLMVEADAKLFDRELGRILELPAEIMPTTILAEAGLLARRADGLYGAKFAKLNQHLDSRFIPLNRRSRIRAGFKRVEEASWRAMPKINAQIPADAWLRADQTRIPNETMDRAIRVIYMVDSILQLSVREPKNYEVGILSDACRIVEKFEWRQLVGLLQRLYFSRSQSEQLLTRNSNLLLKNFDSIIATLTPIQ